MDRTQSITSPKEALSKRLNLPSEVLAAFGGHRMAPHPAKHDESRSPMLSRSSFHNHDLALSCHVIVTAGFFSFNVTCFVVPALASKIFSSDFFTSCKTPPEAKNFFVFFKGKNKMRRAPTHPEDGSEMLCAVFLSRSLSRRHCSVVSPSLARHRYCCFVIVVSSLLSRCPPPS